MDTIVNVKPLKDRVLVDIYDDGDQTIMLGGRKFYMLDDTSFVNQTSSERHSGIRPRWALVVGVNDFSKDRGIEVGQKVFLDELKWSRGMKYPRDVENLPTRHRDTVWSIPAEDILGIDENGFSKEEIEKLQPSYPSIDLTKAS